MNAPPRLVNGICSWTRRRPSLSLHMTTSRTRLRPRLISSDLAEIDEEIWNTLPLAFAEPPEDWTEAMDDANVMDADALVASNGQFLRL